MLKNGKIQRNPGCRKMYIKFFKTVCPFNIVYTKLRHETLKVCRPALSYVLHIYAGSVRRGQLSDNERKSIFIENFPKKKKHQIGTKLKVKLGNIFLCLLMREKVSDDDEDN